MVVVVWGLSVLSMFCPTLPSLGDFSCDVNTPVERKSVSPAFVVIVCTCVVSLTVIDESLSK